MQYLLMNNNRFHNARCNNKSYLLTYMFPFHYYYYYYYYYYYAPV